MVKGEICPLRRHRIAIVVASEAKNKTVARDAAAICVATGPTSVRSRSRARRSRLRGLWSVRAITHQAAHQAMNGLRAMLAEFGVVAAQGARGFAD